MRNIFTACIALGLLAVACLEPKAQGELPEQLISARGAIERAFARSMPGWKRKSITPMDGSDNVIVDNWESDALTVKVAILLHSSEEEAAGSLKKFKHHSEVEEKAAEKHGKKGHRIIKEELPFLADGGFAWEKHGSMATAFRKGNMTVHVILIRPELNHDVFTGKHFASVIGEALSGL